MKKLLSLCLLVSVLLCASPAASIPPQEVFTQLGKKAESFQCSKENVIAVFTSLDETWKVFVNPKNKNVVMIEGDDEGNTVRVFFGTLELVGKVNPTVKLTVLHEMSLEQAQVRFPNPCDFLAPKEV